MATLIARVIEVCSCLHMFTPGNAHCLRFSGLFGWPSAFVKTFVLTSAPVIANEFMWGLGTTMYSLAYGRMGDEAVAAITIATTIQDILVVLFQGLERGHCRYPGQ